MTRAFRLLIQFEQVVVTHESEGNTSPLPPHARAAARRVLESAHKQGE